MDIKTKLLTLALAAGITGRASGQILVNETFDHPNGNLLGQTPKPGPGGTWAAHSGGGNRPIQVTSGQAIVEHADSSGEDLNTGFAVLVTGWIYYGFDFSVSASGPITGTDGEYFAHFKDSAFDFTTRTSIESAQSTGDYTMGFSASSSDPDSLWATDLAFNTVYRAVAGYNIDSGAGQLWLDPTSASSTFISAAADVGVDVESFGLRHSTSDANETIAVDNLIVSTDFNSAAAVPEPEMFGALAGLMVLGFAVFRRRRQG